MTTQSPDQSLSQSPAPSKDMEERINRIAREAGDWAERTYGKSGHLLHYITRQAARSALETLAAELGKERETDRETIAVLQSQVENADVNLEQVKIALQARIQKLQDNIGESHKASAQRILDYEQQLDTLKRELAEAVEVARKYQHEVLALSVAYQRQKVALNEARKAVSEWDGGCAGSACRSLIQVKQALSKALAETPDGSMWQPIESAPKDGTVIDLFVNGHRYADCAWGKPPHECGEAGPYCDSDWHSEKPGWFDTTFCHFIDSKPTHWQPLPPPPTLQPDHQK